MSEAAEETATEGLVTIARKKDHNEAFYNPVQEFNRDLSIACINVFAAATKQQQRREGVRILEALAATGLRSLRYVREVAGVSHVLANDIDDAAIAQIRANAARNGVPIRGGGESSAAEAAVLEISQGDAAAVLHARRTPERARFDVVDLDPYGSPAAFLDAAVQAVAEGGLLCVTFTDMAVLCGAHADVCCTKYGSVPLRRPYCHEAALRIAVACVQAHATRHRRVVQPLLCVSADYYIRLFLRVTTSAARANAVPASLAYIAQCASCDAFRLQPLARAVGRVFSPARVSVPPACAQCGGEFQLGGPLHVAPLADAQFVADVVAWVRALPAERFANTRKRIDAVLSAISEELPEVPLFYSADSLCHTLKLSVPPRHVIENAFVKAGYRVSVSHTSPTAIKTDAPEDFVFDFMRCWARESLPSEKMPSAETQAAAGKEANTPRWRILIRAPGTAIDIKAAAAAERVQKPTGPRFLPNPREHWGPGSRAGRKRTPAEKAAAKAAKRAKRQDDDEGKGEEGATATDAMDTDVPAPAPAPAADPQQ